MVARLHQHDSTSCTDARSVARAKERAACNFHSNDKILMPPWLQHAAFMAQQLGFSIVDSVISTLNDAGYNKT
ncbi:hypothetical protein ZIOFF_068539 [Zingiber officinale]|uniref:Uncharacterized protein n=1 Tax=Zingiber officinale TaxID=94328 RepID=A0A8J5EVN2_ZINOF|nr:hypothetical protein ZIOFF_068539 [Zingiber officinale]